MSTAPMDGTMVLLFVAADEIDDAFQYVGLFDGWWTLANYSAFKYEPCAWQPLPDGPKEIPK